MLEEAELAGDGGFAVGKVVVGKRIELKRLGCIRRLCAEELERALCETSWS